MLADVANNQFVKKNPRTAGMLKLGWANAPSIPK
jgi:hypothetical protein